MHRHFNVFYAYLMIYAAFKKRRVLSVPLTLTSVRLILGSISLETENVEYK